MPAEQIAILLLLPAELLSCYRLAYHVHVHVLLSRIPLLAAGTQMPRYVSTDLGCYDDEAALARRKRWMLYLY